ncbi:MAG: DUF5671 domain-containing protein [Patescibacteria group bacterium]
MKAKTGAKDFFLWAGAMLFLYASIVAFITLLFSYINYVFPDALNYYSQNPYDSGMSYQMAMIIVLAPLFLVLMRVIRRDIEKDESRAELWVRRWALYLTLFVAGITVAADLVTLLYYFLSGQDITLRFLLKVAVVLLVASAGFMHFLADIKGYWVANPKKVQAIGYATGLLVILTIAAGFFIVGTPGQARQYRLDEQRVSDLQNVQWQIVSYWQQKQKLPAQLSDLNDSISGWNMPIDPKTGAGYEYSVKGETSFELCATFASDRAMKSGSSIARPASVYGKDIADNWDHKAGRVCFTRTIDPERYPPINKPTN